MENYNNLVYWNTNSYGNAMRIKKKVLQGVFIFLCCVTPATNWMIPFTKKIIKTDIIVRYN